MNTAKSRNRKNVPIDADLHHRLDVYATSVRATIREIAEEAICAYLASMATRRNQVRPKPSSHSPADHTPAGIQS